MTTDAIANPFGHAFAEYHAKGWSGTLPLPYRKKKTPPPDYTGHTGAYPSYADLHTWADEGPRNICQRMRVDVVGLDVDAYGGKPGAQTLATLVQAFGALPPTYMTTSRDDGISGIRYYRVPAGTTLRDSLPGIELIQRHHRYAVVWPSVHPDTGNTYRWVDEITGEVDCAIPAVDALPELPEAWVNGLHTAAEGTAKATLDGEQLRSTFLGFPEGAPCHHILKAAGKALEGTSRHDAYNAAVLAVCRHGRRGCPGAQTVIGRLRKAFVAEISAPGERATPGEAEAEWRRCLDGALAIVVDEEQGSACIDEATADWINAASTPPNDDTPDEDADRQRTSWWPRDLHGVLTGADPEPEPEFLARLDDVHLFYRGKVNGLLGESESGKTWVALLAVLQSLRARQVVVYLDFEDTAPGIVSRLRAMGATDDDLACLHYIGPDEGLSVQAKADLAEAIQSSTPDLIVLDGINAAMTLLGLELTDNTDATKFSQMLLKPLASTGACVVYVDHVPKSREARGKGGIGAQAKRAMTTGCAINVDVVSAFGRGMTGRLRLTVDKDRPGHVRARAAEATRVGEAVLTSGPDGSVTVEIERIVDDGESAHEEALRREVMLIVKKHGDDGCSRNDLVSASKKTARTLRPHIEWLIRNGQLVESVKTSRGGHPLLVVNPDPDQLRWDLS